MIPIGSGVRIWIATGHTDMRRGLNGLARQVQEGLGRDPFAGDVFVFRGRSGSLIKALWHDGIGLWLYAKRLDRGRFVWPQTVDGVVALTAGQMSYLLEAIDWRNPQHTWRPELALMAATASCRGRPKSRRHSGSRVLGARAPQVLCAGRHWIGCATQGAK